MPFTHHHRRLAALWLSLSLMGGCGDDEDSSPSPSLTPSPTTTPASDNDDDGFSIAAGDCNDDDASISPEGLEVCDYVDNDCDGQIDETDASDARLWYPDGDADGYGAGLPTAACYQPEGHAASNLDCDDSLSNISPDATEVCDAQNLDEDCNGVADDADPQVNFSGRPLYYPDQDADGWGDASSQGKQYCDLPSGVVTNALDCDDTDSAVNPSAQEICDPFAADENCNGVMEGDAVDARTWYADQDGDGYGSSASWRRSCKPLSGYVLNSLDCDDTNEDVNPEATEICDALNSDEDCDGRADDSDSEVALESAQALFTDADEDGFGDALAASRDGCDVRLGESTNSSDCDDSDPARYPGAQESCDTLLDMNCDTLTGTSDSDEDGFVACLECDDRAEDIFPEAPEICDAQDNDCDGLIDDADPSVIPPLEMLYFPDEDEDGFGRDSEAQTFCSDPSSSERRWQMRGGDCDDTLPEVYPGAREICNGLDDDCDGQPDPAGSLGEVLFFADNDHDGFGDPLQGTWSCTLPEGLSEVPLDCDDEDAAINPTALEICNGSSVDLDCDRLIGCDDADCASEASCSGLEICNDGADNDGDALKDCSDPDCLTHSSCQPPPCVDGPLFVDWPLLGSTSGQSNDQEGSCGGASAPDITVRFTVPESGDYQISTEGSSFDTLVYALAQSCSGEELQCNDDRSLEDRDSLLDLSLLEGAEVIIVVDGFGNEVGDFQLTIFQAAP